MLYVAVSERLHVSSTRCDHCQTCYETILFSLSTLSTEIFLAYVVQSNVWLSSEESV